MDLILWRHAEAVDAFPDLGRELTDKGRKQASRMADWLNPRLPPDIRILVSPALRTLQTAQALGREYEQMQALAPGAGAGELLAVAGWPDSTRPVLIVGHQPTLGQVAMRLLTGQRAGQLQGVLRAVAAPEWL